MKNRISVFLIVVTALACHAPNKMDPAAAPNEITEHVGPCIHGRVTDVHGVPKADVAVSAYGGIATRWGIGGTRTDSDGNYYLCGLEGGGLIKNEESDDWDLYIGVCVGDSKGQNPAAVLPWKDVRLPNKPDAVVELNFNCSLEEIAAIE